MIEKSHCRKFCTQTLVSLVVHILVACFIEQFEPINMILVIEFHEAFYSRNQVKLHYDIQNHNSKLQIY